MSGAIPFPTCLQEVQRGHICFYFLGAQATLRKATISFVLSVCPRKTTRFPQDGFS